MKDRGLRDPDEIADPEKENASLCLLEPRSSEHLRLDITVIFFI